MANRYAVAALVREERGGKEHLTLRILDADSRSQAERIGRVCCEQVEQEVLEITAKRCEQVTNSGGR